MTEALLSSWSLQPQATIPLVLLAVFYTHGWFLLRRSGQRRFAAKQLACFLGGLATVFVAVASPLDPLGVFLLQLHMLQHLLLLLVAAPLVWLGAPQLPCLIGLPGWLRRDWVLPILRLRMLHRALRHVTRPAFAWISMTVAVWLWHAPQLYGLALRSPSWHYVEHACFIAAGLLFWFPVIQPYPSRPRFSPWLLLPYLFLAGVQGTVLSALLTFADHVLYAHYAAVPRLWNVSPLTDQALAGAIMWIGGSIAYLVPLVWIGGRLLYGHPAAVRPAESLFRSTARPLSSALSTGGGEWSFGGHDVLRLPVAGQFLRWRYARSAMQIAMLAAAMVVILDGLLGPQITPLNLAGVLPWIVWRGLVVFGLLLAGNLFCAACPFMFAGGLARRWLPGKRDWPRWLAGKWPAVLLLVLFFWAYEALSLWDNPRGTACIATAYFALALVIDGVFRSAAFCKHVCPIGQFNFVNSLMSPLEVRVRDPHLCDRCVTKDCISRTWLHPRV